MQQQNTSKSPPSKAPAIVRGPVPLSLSELAKVSGAGPNGGWSTCGPNGGWL
jgi:hypothetical protein